MSNINLDPKIDEIVENHCHTKADLKKCTFAWTIDEYSFLARRNDEEDLFLKSSAFSAREDDLKWHLKHSIFWKKNAMHASLQLLPDCNDILQQYVPLYGFVEISVRKPDSKESITRTSSFTCPRSLYGDDIDPDVDPDYFFNPQYFSFDELEQYIFEDKLTIFCNLTYMKSNSIVNVNVSSPRYSPPVNVSGESSISRDLERVFIDECFSDLTVSVKGKNYQAHKIILAARSSVFSAMLKNNMQESKKNRINVTDIEPEIFEEVLNYIYSGKVKNLDELAFELLPAADKYDLKELGIMCEEVLLEKLSAENAVKILILADLHHAEKLKTRALRFIKVNYANCKKSLESEEVWKDLTSSRAQLLRDMLNVFCKN